MVELKINFDVTQEYNELGDLMGLHVCPVKTAHCVTGQNCWCKPTLSKNVSVTIIEAGIEVPIFMHHYYKPIGENGYGQPLDFARWSSSIRS